MVINMTYSSETAHSLIEKVLASKPPIAELIGLRSRKFGRGARWGCCSQDRNTPTHGNASRRCAVRPGGCGYGHGLCVYVGSRRIFYCDHAQYQFLPTCLAHAAGGRG